MHVQTNKKLLLSKYTLKIMEEIKPESHLPKHVFSQNVENNFSDL